MSRLLRGSLVAMILTGLSLIAGAQEKKEEQKAAPAEAKKPAPPIFADKNLEAVIREILRKKTDEKEIKEADLKNIYFLNGRGRKIENLAGLEKCTNLASVKLSDNTISSLAPLAGLKNIQMLDLANNKIADIAPLAKLEKLQYLKLDGNQIEQLDGLKDLKKLMALYLPKNKITSVAPLSGLEKLSSLYLDENQIVDIAPLANLKWLSSLNLQGNQITDLSPLTNMTELRYTMLQQNKIADVSTLIAMAKKDAEGDKRFAPYWNLYLAGNPLNESARDAQLAELKKYGVRVKMK